MSLLFYLSLALIGLQSSTSSTAFSPPSSLPAQRLRLKMTYHNQKPLDVTPDIDETLDQFYGSHVSATVEKPEYDWFPLVLVETLDRENPKPFKLPGMDVVVFKGEEILEERAGMSVRFGHKADHPRETKQTDGTWRVLGCDRCTHHSARLNKSTGDDGSIMCSYKGDDDLANTSQHQELQKIKKNPGDSYKMFPVKVKNGTLWMWAHAGLGARIQSEFTTLPDLSLKGLLDTGDQSWPEVLPKDRFAQEVTTANPKIRNVTTASKGKPITKKTQRMFRAGSRTPARFVHSFSGLASVLLSSCRMVQSSLVAAPHTPSWLAAEALAACTASILGLTRLKWDTDREASRRKAFTSTPVLNAVIVV